jgi:ATP/maltotriose-dependent transcriptional regulator MalT
MAIVGEVTVQEGSFRAKVKHEAPHGEGAFQGLPDFSVSEPNVPVQGLLLPRRKLRQLYAPVRSGGLLCLVAGPGYGKTVFMLDAFKQYTGPTVYLSLDSAHRDAAHFVTSLAEGLEPFYPQCSALVRNSLSMCANSDRASVDLAGVMLARCLPPDAPPTLIALDDLHLVEDAEVTVEAVRALVSNLPARWTVILASRHPVPFSLDRLRGRMHLAQVDPRHFRLTPSEIIAWAAQFWDVILDLDHARTLWRLTEGWPVALVLLGQHVQSHLRPGTDVARLLKKGRQLNEYLAENVFRFLDPASARILMAASPLARVVFPRDQSLFPGEPGEAEAELEMLVARGFLVTRTGSRTFTLHPLVRAYAERELSAAARGGSMPLVLATARHLEKAGELADAVSLYLRAGDAESAARPLRELALSCLNATSNYTRTEWLNQIPEDILSGDPWLLMSKAHILKGRGRYADAAPLYRSAARVLEGAEDRSGLLQACLGEAFALYMTGRWEDSLGVLEKAERISTGHLEKAEVLCTMGHVLAGRCQWDDAVERWEVALAMVPRAERRTFEARVDNYRAHLFYLRGEYATAAEWAERAVRLSVGQAPAQYATSLNSAATALYSLGRYDEAGMRVEAALALVQAKGLHFLEAPVHLSQAAVCLGRGDVRSGLVSIKRALDISGVAGDVEAEVWARDMLGELCRRNQNPEQALVHHSTTLELAESNQLALYERCRAHCNVGIDLAVLGRHSEALPILEAAAGPCRAADLAGLLAMCQTYVGWCYAKRGEERPAFAALEEAMDLATRNHQVHFFTQEASVALPILALCDRNGLGAFPCSQVVPLLSAWQAALFQDMAEGSPYPTDVPLGRLGRSRLVRGTERAEPEGHESAGIEADPLIKQLTERELEILRLMALGMPNKVIAGRLFITEKTTKTHANNIFRKLDVRNRMQAALVLQDYQRRHRLGGTGAGRPSS